MKPTTTVRLQPTNVSSAPTRELAQRLSGADEVLLLWRPETDRVELSVRDVVTGSGFRIEVAAANAMDAFYHPYAYRALIDRYLRGAEPSAA